MRSLVDFLKFTGLFFVWVVMWPVGVFGGGDYWKFTQLVLDRDMDFFFEKCYGESWCGESKCWDEVEEGIEKYGTCWRRAGEHFYDALLMFVESLDPLDEDEFVLKELLVGDLEDLRLAIEEWGGGVECNRPWGCDGEVAVCLEEVKAYQARMLSVQTWVRSKIVKFLDARYEYRLLPDLCFEPPYYCWRKERVNDRKPGALTRLLEERFEEWMEL